MIWVAGIAGVLALLVAVAAVLGSRVPAEHSVSRERRLPFPPDAVWATITDLEHQEWRSDLRRARRLADDGGRPVWEETFRRGMSIRLRTDESTAPRRWVRTVVDGDGFEGEWTYVLEPQDGGCRIQITERGEARNPVFRFMSQFFDMSATLESYLSDLERHLVPAPAPSAPAAAQPAEG